MQSGDQPGESTSADSLTAAATVPPEASRKFEPYERVGLIEPGMALATVENRYGTGALTETELAVGEGETVPGYLLFPGTHDELAIELGEDKQPLRVRFHHPRADWHHASTGLTIGSTLREVREMNAAPFVLSGFGWDYGGTVTDWRGGELAGITVRFTYQPERLIGGAMADSLRGDVALYSDSSYLEGLGLTVREIIVPLR